LETLDVSINVFLGVANICVGLLAECGEFSFRTPCSHEELVEGAVVVLLG
jgi:hypothetical protein